jgi:peptide/nickel transport system ATP-binding protein
MYAGEIVEQGLTREVLAAPAHPYTKGLLASLPQRNEPGLPLPTIQGSLAALSGDTAGCPFRARCPIGNETCACNHPQLEEIAPGHLVRCWHHP